MKEGLEQAKEASSIAGNTTIQNAKEFIKDTFIEGESKSLEDNGNNIKGDQNERDNSKAYALSNERSH